MKPTQTAAAILLTIAALPLFAESRSATMNVSVTVVARAVLTVDQQPEQVVVTADDLRRGYIDVSVPMRVHVRTNARGGYILHVVNTEPSFSSAILTSGNLTMNVLSESIIARPYQPGADSMVMSVRLNLSANAQAGTYPFPIIVDATPAA